MTLMSHHLLLEHWTVLKKNPEKVSFDIFDKLGFGENQLQYFAKINFFFLNPE